MRVVMNVEQAATAEKLGLTQTSIAGGLMHYLLGGIVRRSIGVKRLNGRTYHEESARGNDRVAWPVH